MFPFSKNLTIVYHTFSANYAHGSMYCPTIGVWVPQILGYKWTKYWGINGSILGYIYPKYWVYIHQILGYKWAKYIRLVYETEKIRLLLSTIFDASTKCHKLLIHTSKELVSIHIWPPKTYPNLGTKNTTFFSFIIYPKILGFHTPKFGVFWGVWVGTYWVNVELCFSPFDVYVKEQICFQNTRLAFQLAGGYMISFHLAPRAVHSQTRGIAFWSTAPWTLRSFLNPWKSHSPSL